MAHFESFSFLSKISSLKKISQNILRIFFGTLFVKNYVEPMFPLPVVFLVVVFFLIHTVCFPHEPIIKIVDTVYENL